jgi:hypothetical protein
LLEVFEAKEAEPTFLKNVCSHIFGLMPGTEVTVYHIRKNRIAARILTKEHFRTEKFYRHRSPFAQRSERFGGKEINPRVPNLNTPYLKNIMPITDSHVCVRRTWVAKEFFRAFQEHGAQLCSRC